LKITANVPKTTGTSEKPATLNFQETRVETRKRRVGGGGHFSLTDWGRHVQVSDVQFEGDKAWLRFTRGGLWIRETHPTKETDQQKERHDGGGRE